MGKFTTVTYSRFLGLNEDENPHALADNELSVASNVWRFGNTTGTRPGIEREGTGDDYDAQLADGSVAVQGLVEYRNSFDATRYLVAVANGKIWRNDTNTITKGAGVTVTAGQDNLWTFAQHKGSLYAAGGANGDTVWSWDGNPANSAALVTFTDIAGPTQIDAKFIYEKWNHGFLGGMNGTTVEDNPMVVRYSAINDMTSWPTANTIGGTSAIGGLSSYGDEFITGFADYTDNRGDYLLVLTNKALYPVVLDATNDFAVTSAVQNGCVNQRAYVTLGLDSGDAVYMSETGIHSIRQSQAHGGAETRFLSWKIRNTFKTLNKARLKYAWGAYWRDEGYVLFAVSTGSNTAHDLILALDVKDVEELTAENARWSLWTPASISTNALIAARDKTTTNKQYVYLGTTNGNICRFTRDTFSDLGSAYQVQFRTKHSNLGAPGVQKGVGDVYVHVQSEGTHRPTMKIIYDFGTRPGPAKSLRLRNSGALYGAAIYGAATYASRNTTTVNKIYGTGQGETVAFDFTHKGANQALQVAMVAAQIRGIGETQSDFAAG